MKQLAIDDQLGRLEEPGYQFPGVRPVGSCRSSLFAPPEFALQMVRATLARGTELHGSPRAGDEVVYVAAGSLSTGEERCPTGGALLIDEGAELHLQAESETVLLHFGRQGTVGRRRPQRPPHAGAGGRTGRRLRHRGRGTGHPLLSPSPTRTSPPPSSPPGEQDRIDPSPTATPRTRSSTWPREASRSGRARSRPARPSPFPPTAGTASVATMPGSPC